MKNINARLNWLNIIKEIKISRLFYFKIIELIIFDRFSRIEKLVYFRVKLLDWLSVIKYF